MSKRSGFSIIELVIAVSLASFVLVGVATIAAQMTRAQIDGIRKGTATGWSLVSYMSMAKEIEDSNVMAWPIADGAGSDSLVVYKNWSRAQGALPGGMLDGSVNARVSIVQYCVDTTDATNLVVRRFERTGTVTVLNTPPFTPPNPGAAVPCVNPPSGTWTNTSVIGFRMERLSGFPNMFTRDNSIGGVRIRYAIGRQTPTSNDPNPSSTPFDIGVAMQKQYSTTLD